MELLNKLGIDWRLLIAQLINFSLLLFVLHRFLYKPLLKVLEERRRQIEENEKRSKFLAGKLEAVQKEYEEKIREGERQREKILKEAELRGQKIREELLEKAGKEREEFLKEGRQVALRERKETLELIHKESRLLVKVAVRKILQALSDAKTSELFWEKAQKEIEKIK